MCFVKSRRGRNDNWNKVAMLRVYRWEIGKRRRDDLRLEDEALHLFLENVSFFSEEKRGERALMLGHAEKEEGLEVDKS